MIRAGFWFAVAAALCLALSAPPARGKWDGKPTQYSEFFRSLKNQRGALCCGDGDCHREVEFQWRPRKGDPEFPYEITFDEAGGEWVPVGADNVVNFEKYPLPPGTLSPDVAVACWTRFFEKPDWGKRFDDRRPWHVYCLVVPTYG